MKITRPLAFVALLLLPACLPKRPEIPGVRVPAGPLVQALEQQRRSFTGLKAVASVKMARAGGKRSFDTVGIVLDDRRRLRVEAYGPLGQSLVTLLWDGKDALLRLSDGRILRPGQAGMEKIFGMGIEAKELCAVLAGTVPESVPPADAQAYCAQNGVCVVEFPEEKDTVRRVHVLSSATGAAARIRMSAQEVYRSDRLAYRARYEGLAEKTSSIPLPGTITIDNPEKDVSVTITYAEADVNVPIGDDAFTMEETSK
ncbi:MAG TPA: hypothetical protein VF903_11740 [Nitrospirota bacterium]